MRRLPELLLHPGEHRGETILVLAVRRRPVDLRELRPSLQVGPQGEAGEADRVGAEREQRLGLRRAGAQRRRRTWPRAGQGQGSRGVRAAAPRGRR